MKVLYALLCHALFISQALAQLPIHELLYGGPQVEFLTKASGYTADEIDQLGDLRNFDSPKAFLFARKAFADKVFGYLKEHPEQMPPGLRVVENGCLDVEVSKYVSLGSFPRMLGIFTIDLCGHYSGEEAKKNYR